MTIYPNCPECRKRPEGCGQHDVTAKGNITNTLPPFPYPVGLGLEADGWMLVRALDGNFWVENPIGEGVHVKKEQVAKMLENFFREVF